MTITKSHLRAAGIIAGIAVIWLAADWLIITDKEQVRSVISQMARAVEKGDTEALFAHVSPGYSDEVHSYISLRLLAEMFIKRHEEAGVSVGDMQVTVSGAAAAARLRAWVSTPDEGSSVSIWQLHFERGIEGQWLLTSLTPISFDGKEVNGWAGLHEIGWQ